MQMVPYKHGTNTTKPGGKKSVNKIYDRQQFMTTIYATHFSLVGYTIRYLYVIWIKMVKSCKIYKIENCICEHFIGTMSL